MLTSSSTTSTRRAPMLEAVPTCEPLPLACWASCSSPGPMGRSMWKIAPVASGLFAVRDLFFGPDAAAVLVDDAVADRQAQAGALAGVLSREEGVEDAAGDLGRDARAIVADGD